jgi:tRNA wybutosine-synthesizing protein 2
LRRGCWANGWGVRVLRVDDGGRVKDEEGRVEKEALEDLVAELRANGDIRMVAFQGDNRWARTIIERMQEMVKRGMESNDNSSWLNIRHVNLGLLPNSRLAWENAMDVLDSARGGWVHIHENIDMREMEQKRDAVVRDFQAHLGSRSRASCSHIQQVKTYAPGVMHCVFDVHTQPNVISPGGMENG